MNSDDSVDVADRSDAFASLLAHVKSAIRATVVRSPDAPDRGVLDELLVALESVEFVDGAPPSTHQAVDRWLADAVAKVPPEHADFAETFMRCADMLDWVSPYTDLESTPQLEHFWANYASTCVIAPTGNERLTGPFRSSQVSMFLTLQGPDVVYDRHHHPAVEIYGIVSGTGNWLRGDEGVRPRSPGEVFVHQSNMVHATTTVAEPTITWVAWLGDLNTPPAMNAE